MILFEIYKTKSGLSPPFMKDIFTERNTGYNLRHGNDSQIPKVHTTTHGIETISFFGNRLWSTLPNMPGESEKTWGVWRTVTLHLAIRLT